ncbi:MAG TPA: type III pantothenate kinase [Lachnospiraceae bacterium]|nr:type III pantothenate kinase [Lachnospiraceae bacterium]HBZ89738.1 type III pantothenate kinase [Lachnospiraceae bacterium]
MLLAVDIGNTNITFAFMKNGEVHSQFRFITKNISTSDEYGIKIIDFMNFYKIDIKDVENAIITSVVPGVMYSINSALIKYLGITPMIIGTGLKTGIKVITPNPQQIGADRIVDAAGAMAEFGGPVLVIDFGTATTYDLVLKDGSFAAGITSPGLKICANALWNETAKLPEIEIKKPDSILAKDTVTSMQAGLVYGYIGQTEYIIKKVREESKIPDLRAVATGGLGRLICSNTELIYKYDPDLTMKGLWAIAERNA